MRFPSDESGYFGITRLIDHSIAVSKQAQKIAAQVIDRKELADRIKPIVIVEPPLNAEGYDVSLLYLMRIDPNDFLAETQWLRIVDVLRSLPQGSVRRAYMKAMQVFAGTLDQELDVLEVDKEVNARLDELLSLESNLIVK
jgi:hypothetical protein